MHLPHPSGFGTAGLSSLDHVSAAGVFLFHAMERSSHNSRHPEAWRKLCHRGGDDARPRAASRARSLGPVACHAARAAAG
ncbi:hypothetical protein EMEDMD4_90146 [Sinorhizobium medicae]|uniref:Uncharacterized protein n=1 Tax=Sinorhizobium medicae TaxID=110321 RepID=A0A508XBD2_9HYPH|nr:hypothetical protein EMEDMD4_90146 [Sinorhizobium medicae]